MKRQINKLPIIGVTLDISNNNSSYPWYTVRQNYADAIITNGGIPVLLPIAMDYISYYVEMIDGLLITGGDFDIDPSYYEEIIKSETVCPNPKRTEFEIAVLLEALKLNKAILGICGGMQLINVVMGGSLIQDIIEETGSAIHQQLESKHIPTHNITVKKATKLYQILQHDVIKVNSSHHQSVKRLGRNIVPSAHATDQIIEAIELSNYKFCLGVQWHPEYLTSQNDRAIFDAFIHAACSRIA